MYQHYRHYSDATENSCELAAIVENAGWEFTINQLRFIARAVYDAQRMAEVLDGVVDEARMADSFIAWLAKKTSRHPPGKS